MLVNGLSTTDSRGQDIFECSPHESLAQPGKKILNVPLIYMHGIILVIREHSKMGCPLQNSTAHVDHGLQCEVFECQSFSPSILCLVTDRL